MVTAQLVDRVSNVLARHSNRRGFLSRAAVVGSALTVAGPTYVLRPTSAYAAVCSCLGRSCDCGSLCCDGYTEFCCAIYGENSCPPNTVLAGWWKVDNSHFCNGSARYYMDCNKQSPNCGCGSTGVCRGSDTVCQCRSCSNRKDGCTTFRYGNCNNHISCVGPIMCRVVTCAKPWELDPGCSTVPRTDNNTRYHHRACLDGPPAPPEPRTAPADIMSFQDGVWRFRRTQSEGPPEVEFSYGQAGDLPLMGDWNGDGTVGIGVRRGRTFILRNEASAGAPDHIFDWGRADDIPLVGDWNGNGRDTVGLKRGRTWFLKNRLDGSPHEIQFDWGRDTDLPITGDWSGNGRTGVGIKRGRPWYLKNRLEATTHEIEFAWGRDTDVPVTGDWDGDGRTGVGIVLDYRWYLKNELDPSGHHSEFSFGQPGDTYFGWDQTS
ncbi:MAG TPA: hypothetical protein VLR27_12430 [Acidimicrobiales bacterium]|nr:hypothetical protein [Acidimicrobiales bacterium]